MRHWKSPLLALICFVVMLPMAVRSQQPATNTLKPAANGESNPVHSITLPDYAPEIPRGPHVNTFTENCLICHSARYVLIQPRFPKKVWAAEVKKMVGSYGATISEHDQALIVDYLTVVHGVESPATKGQ